MFFLESLFNILPFLFCFIKRMHGSTIDGVCYRTALPTGVLLTMTFAQDLPNTAALGSIQTNNQMSITRESGSTQNVHGILIQFVNYLNLKNKMQFTLKLAVCLCSFLRCIGYVKH